MMGIRVAFVAGCLLIALGSCSHGTGKTMPGTVYSVARVEKSTPDFHRPEFFGVLLFE